MYININYCKRERLFYRLILMRVKLRDKICIYKILDINFNILFQQVYDKNLIE